ncbi:MAG: hypothetical protein QOH41_2657 [Blastocatellia bacterium]|nr:hypothetical protein [Blastocatellia bacterium]
MATRFECDDDVVGNHDRVWNGREQVYLFRTAAFALANADTITVTIAFPVADPATIAFADSVTIAVTVGKTNGHAEANAETNAHAEANAETNAHAKADSDSDSEANADAQTNCHTKADRHSDV